MTFDSHNRASKKLVCFVSQTGNALPWNDGSTRYRCFYPAELLRSLGFYAGVMSLDQFLVEDVIADAYVFHRPRYSSFFASRLDAHRKRGARLIADYDDLIFGVENFKHSPHYEKTRNVVDTTSLFNDNSRALRLFNRITTSTPELARHAAEQNPGAQVEIVRNGFPQKLLDHAWKRVCRKRPTAHAMGYFPGTRTHDTDFLTWADELSDATAKTGVPLRIVGELSPEVYASIPNTTYKRGGSFLDLIDHMATTSISLAPLKNSPFNRSKSNIKAIESFLVGCYSISTALNDTVILKQQGFDIVLKDQDTGPLSDNVSEIASRPAFSETNAELVQQLYTNREVCKPLLELLS